MPQLERFSSRNKGLRPAESSWHFLDVSCVPRKLLPRLLKLLAVHFRSNRSVSAMLFGRTTCGWCG